MFVEQTFGGTAAGVGENVCVHNSTARLFLAIRRFWFIAYFGRASLLFSCFELIIKDNQLVERCNQQSTEKAKIVKL